MKPDGSSLVVFHENTETPTTDLHSLWLVTPPRHGEVVNFVARTDKREFIGRVVDVVWFLPPLFSDAGPTVKIYLDRVITPGTKPRRRRR